MIGGGSEAIENDLHGLVELDATSMSEQRDLSRSTNPLRYTAFVHTKSVAAVLAIQTQWLIDVRDAAEGCGESINPGRVKADADPPRLRIEVSMARFAARKDPTRLRVIKDRRRHGF
jgi:hypothetical protein